MTREMPNSICDGDEAFTDYPSSFTSRTDTDRCCGLPFPSGILSLTLYCGLATESGQTDTTQQTVVVVC